MSEGKSPVTTGGSHAPSASTSSTSTIASENRRFARSPATAP